MLVVHEEHLKEIQIAKQEIIPVLHAYYKYCVTVNTLDLVCLY